MLDTDSSTRGCPMVLSTPLRYGLRPTQGALGFEVSEEVRRGKKRESANQGLEQISLRTRSRVA